jgi:4-amino-4-deoxy-L-arabinose transferase-like glycosyltransferase
LTWIYSLLGVIGGWLLWRSRDHDARRWLLLAALLIFLRLGFFSALENPEPRYTVEIFPFLIILAGAGVSAIRELVKATELAAAPTAEYSLD